MTDQIPRINLHDYQSDDAASRAALVETLGRAFEDYGFVVVANHGLDPAMIAHTYDCFKRFFALDQATKDKYIGAFAGQRGYTPFGKEQAKDADVPDLKEFWHIGQELPEGHAYRAHYPDNIWPEEIAELKETALTLYRAYEQCAVTILQALADFYQLPRETFASMMDTGDSILRVIHYPPLDKAMPAGAVRAAAHEDINLITLLTQSEGAGLEILTNKGTWLPVHALEGDIIVDSGDMLKRCTNGVIPATTHRVVNPEESENTARYSMPFFVHPFAACDLAVKDRFVSEDQPAQWPAITARAFLKQRLREIGLLGDDD